MDILDIDEALKDDSFICLEEKTYDDVSNILQQWKNNIFFPITHTPEKSQLPLQTQHQQDNGYTLNSRTFTRPKRKLAQGIESQKLKSPANCTHNQSFQTQLHMQQQSQNNALPTLNLEVGGLVTSMHKSSLQDTSPPSSICSSMDMSVECINNSLITSADFTNISFLQSPKCLDTDNVNSCINLDDKAISKNYTLSDVIRDRESLESLTLSGEGTLLKDIEIAQIDDMCLVLNKTASGCSTMNNSMDSMEGKSRQSRITDNFNATRNQRDLTASERIINLNDEMIGDISLPFPQNSFISEEYCEASDNIRHLPESTPKTTNLRYEKNGCNLQRKHLIKIVADANISPILMPKPDEDLNGTFKISSNNRNSSENNKAALSQTFLSAKSSESFRISENKKKMLKNEENLNETYNKNMEFDHITQSLADMEMQSIMQLAQAEVELLVDNVGNEDEFEQMLDAYSKVELNTDQLKIKQSLESIKKRFNCNFNQNDIDHEQRQLQANLVAFNVQRNFNEAMEMRSEDLRKLKESIKDNKFLPATPRDNSLHSPNSSTTSTTNNSANSSGERLLSRRSRLYDDVHISTLSPGELKISPSCSKTYLKNSLEELLNSNQNETETLNLNNNLLSTNNNEEIIKKTEENCTPIGLSNIYSQYKLIEKRKRDNERFKTIKINKQQYSVGDSGVENANTLNVPCIENEMDYGSTLQSSISTSDNAIEEFNVPTTLPQRYSRRDQLFNKFHRTNNKTGTNYLTYKKPPVDKQLLLQKLPEVDPNNILMNNVPSRISSHIKVAPKIRALEPRSLSRPRFLSGLQKCVVSKAPSAVDVGYAITGAGNTIAIPSDSTVGRFNRKQLNNFAGEKEVISNVKSPMGVKSKSFHNLSTTFGDPCCAPRGSTAPKSTSSLKKLQADGNTFTEKHGAEPSPLCTVANQQQKFDVGLFKAPQLVSGIRAPGTKGFACGKRLLSVRPSSGYFSLNVNAKTQLKQVNNADFDAGRHSPTDSTSSASSHGSCEKRNNYNGKNVSSTNAALPLHAPMIMTTTKLTKVTNGSTGIPKPSGIKPPTIIKKSSLPRPASNKK